MGTERLCPNNIPIPKTSVGPGSAPQRYSSLGISCRPHRPCTSTAWLSLCSPPATTQSLGWDNSTCHLWPWLWAIVWTQRTKHSHMETQPECLCQHEHGSGRGWDNGVTTGCSSRRAVALSGDRTQGERTACSGNVLLYSAKEAKPQRVRWTVVRFFWSSYQQN